MGLFGKVDLKGDGSIDQSELSAILEALQPSWTEADSMSLFRACDANRDGMIEIQKFFDWVFQSGNFQNAIDESNPGMYLSSSSPPSNEMLASSKSLASNSKVSAPYEQPSDQWKP